MPYDPNTSSNINEVQTTHLELNLKVDFERKILDGSVILSLIALADNINKVILDTRNLDVKSVSQNGKELKVNIL
jgi:leukotriene-A4 hydrolase